MATESWRVRDTESGNERILDSRSEAEETKEELENDLGLSVEIIPPNGDGEANPPDEYPEELCAICDKPVSIEEARSVNGKPAHEDCFQRKYGLGGGADPDGAVDVATTEPEVVEVDPEAEAGTPNPSAGYDLSERSVSDDPLTWIPGEFIDTIDGTQAINRKGFEVLAHFYKIDVYSDLQVAPEETDHTYCRVKARAVTEDGRECEAYGSAHVDRGDEAHLLLEMADTRARKRALSIATGVGAVAVEELKNEVDQ